MLMPYKVLGRIAFVAVLALTLSMPAYATSITIGAPPDPSSGNCFPFDGSGCGVPGPGDRYQQVYHNTLFGGSPLLITSVDFFNTQFSPGNNAPSATFNVHLSTTSRAVNALDTVTFANNVGADDLLAFSGTIGGVGSIVGGVLHISLTTPFLYNPVAGNLLLDMFRTSASTGDSVFFDARSGTFGTDSSRAHNYGSGFESFGLVTRFNADATVPEPATLVLVCSGLALVRRVRARRK
jgi:PEP-CTERM motif